MLLFLKKEVPLHDFFLFKCVHAVGLLRLNFYEVKKTYIHTEIYSSNNPDCNPEALQILY